MNVQELEVRLFRISFDDGTYYDCVTPLDNLGVITMVTDENGKVVPHQKWVYFEEVISQYI